MNSGLLKGLDLTGVEQLNDAFFIMLQFLNDNSSLFDSVDNLCLVGCTHITDLSAGCITKLFPNLTQAIIYDLCAHLN